jgi:hypothetical protein
MVLRRKKYRTNQIGVKQAAKIIFIITFPFSIVYIAQHNTNNVMCQQGYYDLAKDLKKPDNAKKEGKRTVS